MVNGVNMVEREITVGERDEKGKLKLKKRVLLVGDPMPRRVHRRVLSNEELLQKNLSKLLRNNA